jgi:formate dehydrogenase subunit gamma
MKEVTAMSNKSNYELIEVTNTFERFVHWALAISCILLFISGFGLMFKSLNWIGTLIGGTSSLIVLHNWSSPVFAASGFLAFIIWFKEGALMTADDIKWICKGGGYLWLKNGVPEPGRFNGGQKIFYLIMVATCILMSITGYIMIYPFDFAKDTVVMAYPLHIIGVMTFGGTWIIHAFLGTFANPGTLEAMLSGKCTRAWAKLQHGKWLKEIEK